MSYNQPGPYGPPQPPIPPQQPQAGAWGPQQQPAPYYGQQPGMPGQYPGMPGPYPPPVPPQGGGKGRAIGIAVGAVVVVGALVGGILFFTSGGDGDGKVKPYTMEMPETLFDGKYTKSKTGSRSPENLSNDAKIKEMGIVNGTGVKGSYANPEKQKLRVTGVYGEVADPNKSVDAMLAKMDENQSRSASTYGMKPVLVSPTAVYHPGDFDGAVMKCLTQKAEKSYSSTSTHTEVSTCIWGDSSAIGIVEHQVTKTTGGFAGTATSASGNVMSAKELSEAAAKIRNAVRKEK
ncbi:hypothetical protein [Streptomyces sp. NPDC053048]|uniref:hypothetical protein n=1 Tax=Streptomyces sp. NPDC053048 TaxID=3365694 RepID=UPI0037D3EC3E